MKRTPAPRRPLLSITTEPAGPRPSVAFLRARESALVADLRLGRAEAWATFEERYGRLIRFAIARVLRAPTFCAEDHDEVHARVYFRLLEGGMRRLAMFDAEKSRLTTWLVVLVQNLSRDYARSLTERAPDLVPLESAESIPLDAPAPEELADWRERATLYRRAVDELSPHDRELLTLSCDDELTPEAAASRLGIGVKTFYSRRNRLTARLRATMELALAA
jgi:RNA polymerase sigma factor (sigma-70 family)